MLPLVARARKRSACGTAGAGAGAQALARMPELAGDVGELALRVPPRTSRIPAPPVPRAPARSAAPSSVLRGAANVDAGSSPGPGAGEWSLRRSERETVRVERREAGAAIVARFSGPAALPAVHSGGEGGEAASLKREIARARARARERAWPSWWQALAPGGGAGAWERVGTLAVRLVCRANQRRPGDSRDKRPRAAHLGP
mmetsp:Transcript_2957/g.12089  ORF Transcript_2957/g.12089 Transcript_2957/m.12089 type:complete len:201 (+) Transcript_2957:3252-3854(+)